MSSLQTLQIFLKAVQSFYFYVLDDKRSYGYYKT